MTERIAKPASDAPLHNRGQLIRMGVDVSGSDYVVALAGNPNVGKSTVFNSLTGLRQHTGNWPGKTVTRAEGGFVFGGRTYKLVDLPGTYSLLATSADEEVARDFLLFGRPDVTVVVADACRLERNLNLVLQVLEITDRVVVCLNLMDEAQRRGILVDAVTLVGELGVPVAPTAARQNEGIDGLLRRLDAVATGQYTCEPRRAAVLSFPLKHVVDDLSQTVSAAFPALPNARWVALRLLDNDERIVHSIATGELGDLSGDKVVDADQDAVIRPDAAVGKAAAGVLAKADQLRWQAGPEFHQSLVEGLYVQAAAIADRVVKRDESRRADEWDHKLDWLLTNRRTGYPIMILMLAIVLWLTVAGANVPSAMLFDLLLGTVHPALKSAAAYLGLPWWLDGLLIDGVYLATAWVVSVMLPPMAIFFPMFTLLEDFGYLPRVAFNLDHTFHRCGAHGKQALTMCMGFGCNAAGVIATRVIDSPRERLIAILTNNFSLCNGRWPTQILIATIFLGALVPPYLSGVVAAGAVAGIALLGVAFMFLAAWVLSRTVLRGETSSFHLELPPYRPPRVMQTLYTSLIDRTIFVLWRAVVFALPAGAAIWLIANVHIGPWSVAEWAIDFLDPVGVLIGLNGVILLAYVVAIPANEIVIPTVLMLTVMTAGMSDVGQGRGVMFEAESATATAAVLHAGGWTVLTGANLMLFSLLHNPCSTTIYTIWKETRSTKWTVLATLMPLGMGVGVCFVVAQVWRLLQG
jgi:ferrous iron transport protein B